MRREDGLLYRPRHDDELLAEGRVLGEELAPRAGHVPEEKPADQRYPPRRGPQRGVDPPCDAAHSPDHRLEHGRIFTVRRCRSRLVRAGFLRDPAAEETSSHRSP